MPDPQPPRHKVRLGDQAAAAKLRQQIAARLAERPEAVMVDNGDHHIVLVDASGDHGILATLWSNGGWSLRWISLTGPVKAIYTDQLGICTPPGWDYQPALDLLTVGALAPAARAPYGYVQDDRVTLIMYAGDCRLETKEDRAVGLWMGTEWFVLEGTDWPPGFRGHADHREVLKHFWACVDDGRVVRLTDRFYNYPYYINAVWDGRRQVIEVHGDDGQSPRLDSTKPYVAWHYDEPVPGEFARYRNAPPAVNQLREWFR